MKTGGLLFMWMVCIILVDCKSNPGTEEKTVEASAKPEEKRPEIIVSKEEGENILRDTNSCTTDTPFDPEMFDSFYREDTSGIPPHIVKKYSGYTDEELIICMLGSRDTAFFIPPKDMKGFLKYGLARNIPNFYSYFVSFNQVSGCRALMYLKKGIQMGSCVAFFFMSFQYNFEEKYRLVVEGFTLGSQMGCGKSSLHLYYLYGFGAWMQSKEPGDIKNYKQFINRDSSAYYLEKAVRQGNPEAAFIYAKENIKIIGREKSFQYLIQCFEHYYFGKVYPGNPGYLQEVVNYIDKNFPSEWKKYRLEKNIRDERF